MKKLVICGNYGATNIGDEAILAGIIKLAQQDFEITALSYSPKYTQKQHNIASCYFLPFGVRSMLRGIFKLEIFRTIRAIKKCDVFVLGGGGLFTNEHWKAVAIWSLHTFAAWIMRKPIIMMAQTVEYIESPFWRSLTIQAFKKAKTISVRDQESCDLLQQMGITDVTVAADPAWLLKASLPDPSPSSKDIVISMRPWKDQNEHIIKVFTEFAEHIHSQGYRPVFMPFQTLKNNDHKLISSITETLQSKEIPFKELIPHSPKEALNFIRSAKATVAMRLHASIFSAICETPFIAIAYSPKVSSFTSQIGMTSQTISLEGFDITTLKLKFDKLLQSHDQITDLLKTEGKAQTQKSQLNFDTISSFVEPNHSM